MFLINQAFIIAALRFSNLVFSQLKENTFPAAKQSVIVCGVLKCEECVTIFFRHPHHNNEGGFMKT